MRVQFGQQLVSLLSQTEPALLTPASVSPADSSGYGSVDDERAMLRDVRGAYQQRKLARGAIPVDANRPLGDVVGTITNACSMRVT